MLDMSQKKFIDTCHKTTEPLTIQKFIDQQFQKQEQCKNEIEKASEAARENVKNCIKAVIDELRHRICGEIFLDETRKQVPNQVNNTNNMKRKEANDVFNKL